MAFGLGRRDRENLPARRQDDMFSQFHRELDRLFDEFTRPFELGPAGAFQGQGMGPMMQEFIPRLNVSGDNENLTVSVELPGIDPNQVEILVEDDLLTIRGEKSQEAEDKKLHRVERSWGRFERTIQLPAEVRSDAAEASFNNGVLTIKLPKIPEMQQQAKRIPIQGAKAAEGAKGQAIAQQPKAEAAQPQQQTAASQQPAQQQKK